MDGAFDLALALPGLLEVRLAAVDEEQAVVHVALEGREDGGYGQVHLAGDLLVGHQGHRIGLRAFCAVTEEADAAHVHVPQYAPLHQLQWRQLLLFTRP